MKVVNVAFDRLAAPADLRRRLHEARALGARSVLLLAGDGVAWPADAIDPWLQSLGLPVFGGVFPAVVHGNEHSRQGLVTVALADAPALTLVQQLDRPDAALAAALRSLDATSPALLVLADGLAPAFARFVEAVFAGFGGGTTFVGGGAGSASLTARPCLFTPEGMRERVALLAALPGPLGVGTGQGWSRLDGPFVATRTEGRRIERLDDRPAAEVYRRCVEPLLGCTLQATNFRQQAQGFPVGLAQPDGSLRVHGPLALEGGALVCVAEVPPQTRVQVMHGAPLPLVEAARRAALQAVDALGLQGAAPEAALLLDCVSRVRVLGPRFGDELVAVERGLRSRGGGGLQPPFGALTLGEFANDGRQGLAFFDKSCVVGAFGRSAAAGDDSALHP
jgi:hypothetical protein